ncbi:hypothetical protein FA95DRAFT_1050949 [Auriscalpium vulgare]|uniref:Uncharacterized protein n=1 Tax=Auriscalpium vulgare TaxID=40419 RepID=A0ACB8SA35_9AGAM|nr:hypothetical protein FA95DRAFT_1050949 [Auriscalpium vulgare]
MGSGMHVMRMGRQADCGPAAALFYPATWLVLGPPLASPSNMQSIRVRRKHAYSSLRDDAPAAAQDPPRRRAVSVVEPPPPVALSRTPSGDDTHLRPYPPAAAARESRISRHLRRSSVTQRSVASDTPGSPRPPSANVHDEVIYEGVQAAVAVPAPAQSHPHGRRLSHVHDALTSHDSHSRLDDDDEETDDDSDEWHDPDEHHDHDVVEHLDVIDPQVATVSALANTANAILIPPLSFYSRKPVIVLPARDADASSGGSGSTDDLDRHVEDVLKRKQNYRRILKGVWAFLKTPVGILFGIYGFLVVFWGAAIVIFLLKMINLHNKTQQDFWVEVCSQIECGLFCVTGIGLIPWRAVDTYRMYKVWRYKKLTRKLRRKAGLPELYDEDDLPDPLYDPHYVHVLSDKDQADLHHQQKEFAKSQTWYRPHGTETHRAFPINLALIICALNDGNSFFQIILAACQWSMNRFRRPDWTTGLLIPAAFGCGIGAGVFIWQGGKKTKRTAKIEAALRRALEMDDKEELKHRAAEGTGHGDQCEASATPGTSTPRGEKAANVPVHTPGIKIEEEMIVPPH